MTAISSISATQPLVVAKAMTPPQVISEAANSINSPTSPSSIVSLGQDTSVIDVQTYTARGLIADPGVAPVWEYTQQDNVSLNMTGNFGSSSSAGRFQGLGASLLNQLAQTNKAISQSVIRSTTGRPLEPAALEAAQAKLHSTAADNAISLTLRTASGKTVQLTLTSQDDGLAVQAQVSGGELSGDELAALGKMADGFQSAIDGLTRNPPTLKLEALTQFDSNVFASVDLNTRLKLNDDSTQTLVLHADADGRSVSMSGAAGDLNLSVDLKNAAIIGDGEQQAKALKGYMNQIEAARKRGDGDRQLLSMFEDAFTTLHGHYPAARAATAPQTVNSIELTDTDHSLLTGLADFSASVAEKSKEGNPARPGELDSFAYDVSQTTENKGRDQLNRTLVQEQQSHLVASYHKPLWPGQKLDLTTDPNSQNYQYFQINDQASSRASIGYEKGALVNASISQSASQSTRISRYVLGHLEEDKTTPLKASKTQNLLGVLNQALQQDKQAKLGRGVSWLKDTLSSIQDKVLLQSDPARLRG